jgi:hypothetical protein
MKVSPFLRQETAKLSRLPQPAFVSGQAAKVGMRFGTLGIHLRAPLTIGAKAAVQGPDNLPVIFPRGDIAFHAYRRTLSPKNQLCPFVDVMH